LIFDMGVDTLINKLASWVIDEKKLVTYKSVCSFLDVDCRQSKELLKTLSEKRPHLEATWLVSGIEKHSKILTYCFSTTDKLTLTKSKLQKVKEEHVYSLRLKPEDKAEHWNCTKDISEAHYKTDLNVMQNVWLDRQNFMSDQILLDHRYSAVRGLEIQRTCVARSNNLCSPSRKKRTKTDDNNGKSFPIKSSLPIKRGSTGTDLPPKKRSKKNSIGDMFSKAKTKGVAQEESKQVKKKLVFGTTTKVKPSVSNTTTSSQEKTIDSSAGVKLQKDQTSSQEIESSLHKMKFKSPQNDQLVVNHTSQHEVSKQKVKSKKPAKKKTGLLNFFSATQKINPFDAYKKENSTKTQFKRTFKKVNKKASTKKKAEKQKRYQASTKPKRRAPLKKNLPEDVEMFADEESEDEDNTWQQLQLEQEKQEEEEELEMHQEALRKRRKPKNSVLDSDSESEAGKANSGLVTGRLQVTPTDMRKPGFLDSSSEDEKPAKLSAKERRALRKAEEEQRQKKLLASRKSNFWGAAKNKVKARKKKTKTRSRTYVDPITKMLVTEEIEETDEEVKEVAA